VNLLKPIRRLVATVVSFLTGVPELTPRQKARLAEIEKEQAGPSPADLTNHQGRPVREL
jgi:uncharacterized protein YciW